MNDVPTQSEHSQFDHSQVDVAEAILEDHHRLLVDNADLGLVLYDGDGVVLSANPSAERILGVPLDQMRGRPSDDPRWAPVDELGHPVRNDQHPVLRALQSGITVQRAILGIHRPTPDGDGGYVWLEFSCEPLFRSADERPYAVVSSFKDVTQRRKTELELRESEARYRLLADNSSDVITRTSRSGVLTWVSPSVRRLLGYSPQGLVGSPSSYLVHPEDLPKAMAAFRDLIHDAADSAVSAANAGTEGIEATEPSEDTDRVVTMRLRRRGGVYVDTEVVMRGVRAPDGTVTEVQSSARDVSARVAAESARRSAEDVFRLALEHAPIGMAVVGLDYRWITVNSALPRLTGHSQVDFEQLSMFELIHPDDRDDVRSTLTAMVEGTLQTCESVIRMKTADGGYLWIQRGTTLVRDPSGAPSYFVLQAVDISDRMRTQETLARRAVTDPLTGISNRTVLHERLDAALVRSRRDGSHVGIVFIDIDHFKSLNDVFGHDAGDEVLRQVAGRLAAAVRDRDTAVRLGGDEFVVLCENADLADLHALADRLFLELGRPFELAWGEANVTCSFGLAVGNGPDAATLLQQADAAMYRSKQDGRSRISVFGPGVSVDAIHESGIERDFARALEDGEFRIVYQPIVRLSDGVVWAREAMVRWQHPTQGLLDASMFLPSIEQSPFVADFGQWVLSRVCRDARSWEDGAIVSVNVSARHLAKADFASVVAAALTGANLPAGRLQLELAESSILQASRGALSSVAKLADVGVLLAIDNFGVGYSSVAALHRLPISTLKIDQSFVTGLPRDTDTGTFVRGVIRMGAGLGIDVVAEGVDTDEQCTWLVEQNCRYAQGCSNQTDGAAGASARQTGALSQAPNASAL